MQTQIIHWQHYTNISSLQHAARDAIVQSAAQAIAKRGRFLIVLAGGTTPRAIYHLLREVQTDWSKWHIYYNDDRCLPRDHADRNSLMVEQTWLSHVSIPRQQIHDIPTELGPVEGAAAYNKTLSGLGDFDLVILGVGEDGHTASLFPGMTWDDTADVIPVFDAPKPPAERVSMSAHRLSAAHKVLFLVSDASKQQAVDDWRAGVAIPASTIKPENGVDVYCCEVNIAA